MLYFVYSLQHSETFDVSHAFLRVTISKAFDRMNHFALYLELMNRNIPKSFLDVLTCWYAKCFAFVCWGNAVCKQFHLGLLAVRQGGILSPCLFAFFIDSMIKKLRAAGYGAFIGQFYFGCLLHADDIILVCHSVTTMQMMLNICSQEARTYLILHLILSNPWRCELARGINIVVCHWY